jgi:hypothetical protein
LKKYIPNVIKFLAKNENRWVQVNSKNPRLWIDIDEKFSILINEDWLKEIEI